MKRVFGLLVLGLLAFTLSCDDDFDITADYEEYTVVYGLLNRDSTCYIKINKAFLGNESALIMAKIPDSSEYGSNLNAKLEEWSGETLVKSIDLEPTEINNKEDGIFYNPYQKVYFTNEPINENNTYKLNINIGEKNITAQTEIIPDFYITRPRAGAAYIKFLDNPDIFNKIEWDAPVNGKYYEAVIRFRYREIYVGGTDSTERSYDWKIGSYLANNTEGGESFEISYKPSQFYALCLSNIPYKDAEQEGNVQTRKPVSVDFIISVANQDFYTYIEVNQSGGGISQVVPEYSNIENGLGLFASRYMKMTSKLLDLDSYQNLENLNIKF